MKVARLVLIAVFFSLAAIADDKHAVSESQLPRAGRPLAPSGVAPVGDSSILDQLRNLADYDGPFAESLKNNHLQKLVESLRSPEAKIEAFELLNKIKYQRLCAYSYASSKEELKAEKERAKLFDKILLDYIESLTPEEAKRLPFLEADTTSVRRHVSDNGPYKGFDYWEDEYIGKKFKEGMGLISPAAFLALIKKGVKPPQSSSRVDPPNWTEVPDGSILENFMAWARICPHSSAWSDPIDSSVLNHLREEKYVAHTLNQAGLNGQAALHRLASIRAWSEDKKTEDTSTIGFNGTTTLSYTPAEKTTYTLRANPKEDERIASEMALFISLGADRKAKDKDGNSPLDLLKKASTVSETVVLNSDEKNTTREEFGTVSLPTEARRKVLSEK